MNVVFTTPYGDFEWDSDKDALNRKNHGLSFEQVVAVFQDEELINIFDDASSDLDEDRFMAIEMMDGILIASVIHTERDVRTRIISDRKATKQEMRIYYDWNGLGKTEKHD